jgi:hypothetical protein
MALIWLNTTARECVQATIEIETQRVLVRRESA